MKLIEAIEKGVADESEELFAAIKENVKDFLNQKIGILAMVATEEQKEILDKLQDMIEKE